MIDADEIRDRVVFRSAHQQCPSCGEGVSGACGFASGVYRYYHCGRPACFDWLVAQELLGRLPHQSTAVPRARWVERSPIRGLRAWTLETRDQNLASLWPYGGAWMAKVFLLIEHVSAPLPLAEAQAWAEAEVARSGRPDQLSNERVADFLRDYRGGAQWRAEYQQQPMPVADPFARSRITQWAPDDAALERRYPDSAIAAWVSPNPRSRWTWFVCSRWSSEPVDQGEEGTVEAARQTADTVLLWLERGRRNDRVRYPNETPWRSRGHRGRR